MSKSSSVRTLLVICNFTLIKFNVSYNRSEREKMLAKTEMEDLQNQLEQMTKSKVSSWNRPTGLFYFATVIRHCSTVCIML